MKLSEGTVKIYLSRLFQKVGAKDRFELALLGLKSIGTDGFEDRKPNLLLSAEASCHLRPIRQTAVPAIIFSQTSWHSRSVGCNQNTRMYFAWQCWVALR